MLFNNKKRDYKPIFSPTSQSYKKEIGCVILSTLLLFLTISCISFNPLDNTLFHYTSNHRVTTNWAGWLGANISAFLLYLFGTASYVLLMCLFVFTYHLFTYKSDKQKRTWPKAIPLFILFITSTALAHYIHTAAWDVVSGGILGSMLHAWLLVMVGAQGSIILLGAILWICLVITFQIPLFPFIRFMGSIIKQALVMSIKTLATICSILWQTIRRKKQPTVPTAQVLTGAVKTNEPEENYWDDFLQPHPLPTQPEQAPNKHLTSLVQRFSSKELFTNSRHVLLLKTPFALIANTVLKKNIFVATLPNSMSIAHTIAQATNETSTKKTSNFSLPDHSLFAQPKEPHNEQKITEESTKRGTMLEEKLLHFGVKGIVTSIKPGPLITLFEYKPEIDSKISKITALEDDLAMALTANSIRIIAPIPGKNAVGFEIANQTRSDVNFYSILQSKEFAQCKARLPLVLGVDVTGKPIVEDLATMPHLLVGGATGSGKSVGLNVMLVSLLCSLNWQHLKLVLIDPKRLEFTPYANIPHLIFPIVTQPTRAISILKWVVQEMEERYEAMAHIGVRNIGEYHRYITTNKQDPKNPFRDIPYLVVIIDELADLMMVAGKEVEVNIVRIAQMARAAGIHMIIATQRPSVDVVTGLIKVNFPSRVAFRVSSKVDSRTILDAQGAEKLLGRGDMLYMHSASPDLKRVHGPYVSDHEIENLSTFLRDQAQPKYLDLNEVLRTENAAQAQDWHDELYEDIIKFVKTADEISISMLQRQYRIGFNRSARIIEKLELDGIIAPAQGSKPRKVLR